MVGPAKFETCIRFRGNQMARRREIKDIDSHESADSNGRDDLLAVSPDELQPLNRFCRDGCPYEVEHGLGTATRFSSSPIPFPAKDACSDSAPDRTRNRPALADSAPTAERLSFRPGT